MTEGAVLSSNRPPAIISACALSMDKHLAFGNEWQGNK